MNVSIPEEIKSDLPPTMWGKLLSATPVIMTVLATALAGLSSSEMTRAQYDRSLAAQLQSKAGDQWGLFQAKRLRAALQSSSLDLMTSLVEVPPFDAGALAHASAQPAADARGPAAAAVGGLHAFAGSPKASLVFGEPPAPTDVLSRYPQIAAATAAVGASRPEPEVMALLLHIDPATITHAFNDATAAAQQFDAASQPREQALAELGRLLARSRGALASATATALERGFAALRLRATGRRYDSEAKLNQTIASLYELQVRNENRSAERHHLRSQRFFYGMLAAQMAVIIATLALAARQRSLLWSLAALAGVAALAFALYVYVTL